MKKLLALLLCLLMCFSLMLGMTACGDDKQDDKDTTSVSNKGDDKNKGDNNKGDSNKSDKELLIGTWVVTVDGADYGYDTEALLEEMPEELQDIDLPALKIKMSYEFTKAGKVTMTLYTTSINDWLDDFADELIKKGADRDEVETLLADYYMENDATMDAEYEVDGDKIAMSIDGDISESEFEVSDDELTITDDDGETLTFTRK